MPLYVSRALLTTKLRWFCIQSQCSNHLPTFCSNFLFCTIALKTSSPFSSSIFRTACMDKGYLTSEQAWLTTYKNTPASNVCKCMNHFRTDKEFAIAYYPYLMQWIDFFLQVTSHFHRLLLFLSQSLHQLLGTRLTQLKSTFRLLRPKRPKALITT